MVLCAAAGNTIMMSSNHTALTGVKTDKVKKNSKGGENPIQMMMIMIVLIIMMMMMIVMIMMMIMIVLIMMKVIKVG